jgi:hypothetical protein
MSWQESSRLLHELLLLFLFLILHLYLVPVDHLLFLDLFGLLILLMLLLLIELLLLPVPIWSHPHGLNLVLSILTHLLLQKDEAMDHHLSLVTLGLVDHLHSDLA